MSLWGRVLVTVSPETTVVRIVIRNSELLVRGSCCLLSGQLGTRSVQTSDSQTQTSELQHTLRYSLVARTRHGPSRVGVARGGHGLGPLARNMARNEARISVSRVVNVILEIAAAVRALAAASAIGVPFGRAAAG